ncbi:uncharacterized protein ACLA_012290 [Aspergillus clavatus NRRL 1]|uniref:DNA/RNA-binding domain-containing protein n=1 Tax=Aspergillus clavatus (strain ATCC 1007 / CBS 513.65 / DSM 816 / NCTC 3887 / NRRL 1 / QM 1276 / 107) TaxID=344612 RepID=A1CAN3_ASPCL|nr:uncharacterized protein ACLA_012290 [Aspergillus clavatus NRRL 1]EAW12801.1 conserved hypothetical protein [Aspergillus clavatus NRRL 1]
MSDTFMLHPQGNGISHVSANISSRERAADQLSAKIMGSPEAPIATGDFAKWSVVRPQPPTENVSPVGSSVINMAQHSASPALSVKRPYSAGAMPDHYDSEALSNQGFISSGSIEVASPHSGKVRQHPSQTRPRRSSKKLGNMLGLPGSRITGDRGIRKTSPSKSDTRLPRLSAYSADDLAGRCRQELSQSDMLQMRSSPTLQEHASKGQPSDRLAGFAARPKGVPESTRGLSLDQKSAGGVSAVAAGTSPHGIFLQPETHPITEEQLISEVRGIYAGLVMVEKKCIEIDKQQSESKNNLSRPQWQALIALHRTLLNEHHDFFLASQHPSASLVLKRLAEKYAMPARMWRYGIHSFLELLRHRLPDSLEHMLTFIYLAYSMMTLLLESVRAFEDTWIECLGDLARYRMAVEEVDLRDREVWAGVARYWYNKAADKNPDVGRIQHHLAVLARPDIIQQLFYYTKSLVSLHPFPSTRESIPSLFNPLLNAPKAHHHYPVIAAFVAAHGCLFYREPSTRFLKSAKDFLSPLDTHVGRMSAAFKTQGVYISSCNFAGLFEYGQPDALLPAAFHQDGVQQGQSLADIHQAATDMWTPACDLHLVEADLMASRNAHGSSRLIFYGSYLTSQTLSVMLDQIGNKNIYPAVHISLAFLWCLASNIRGIQYVEPVVPWRKIVRFLNTMIRDDTDTRLFEGPDFPAAEERKQLPEDFYIRGQIWSQSYYAPHFFDGALTEDEGRFIEVPSLNVSRLYRCLWLGVRIATFNRWMTYDTVSRRFSATTFALELDRIAQRYNPFGDVAPGEFAPQDIEMRDPEEHRVLLSA